MSKEFDDFMKSLGNDDFQTKPGFVERRMALGKLNNDKLWDEIYKSYSGVSDLHDFIDWLKQNYIAPEKIESYE